MAILEHFSTNFALNLLGQEVFFSPLSTALVGILVRSCSFSHSTECKEIKSQFHGPNIASFGRELYHPPPGNSAFLQNATILFSHPNFSKDLRFLNHSALLICSFVENVNEDPIVIVNGLTKCWRLPGWRICWVCHSSSSLAAANHKIFKSQTCLCKCGLVCALFVAPGGGVQQVICKTAFFPRPTALFI